MRFSSQGRLGQQLRSRRPQYLQDRALPFSDILTDDFIGRSRWGLGLPALAELYACQRDPGGFFALKASDAVAVLI